MERELNRQTLFPLGRYEPVRTHYDNEMDLEHVAGLNDPVHFT